MGEGRGWRGGGGGLVKGRGERRVVYFANNFYTIVENEIDVESSIDVKSKMISNLTRSGFNGQ